MVRRFDPSGVQPLSAPSGREHPLACLESGPGTPKSASFLADRGPQAHKSVTVLCYCALEGRLGTGSTPDLRSDGLGIGGYS